MTDAPSVLTALQAALGKAAEYNRDDMAAPAAILWPDKERQWEPLAERLRAELPHFLTLGPYEPEKRTGPAIWIRCLLARALPVNWPEDVPPILYLPGVSRAELRAVEDCPPHLQPLAELQYRGCFWTHVNGKDWTVIAFLQSKEGGLGLDVGPGPATQTAAQRALLKLANTPVESLRGKRLDAVFFTEMLTSDFERDLLTWLDNPEATRQQMPDPEWQAFRARCRKDLEFDPETDGPLTAALLLGTRAGKWGKAWDRFAEAPGRYGNIPQRLRQVSPDSLLDPSSWPQENERCENELRRRLAALFSKSAPAAAAEIKQLEEAHGERREWVWAELGLAPLARALEHLAALAAATAEPLTGAAIEALACSYTRAGWKADAAVLNALAYAEKAADAEAVSAVVRTLYQPWLESGAERLQELAEGSLPPGPPRKRAEYAPGTCLLFADGLRYDLGQRLKDALAARGFKADLSSHWAALPTVTATAKPAVSPLAAQISGDDIGEDFLPQFTAGKKALTPEKFNRALEEQKFQVLGSRDLGSPQGLAWTEFGDIDHFGHQHGWKLASYVTAQFNELAQRIEDLLRFGWKRVIVVTDHGWLLMPGGLPKVDLPAYLAETRWGRCAVLKSKTKTDLPIVPWFWNEEVRVAVAPGIGCFKANTEFSHGGLSLQECLVPALTVRSETNAAIGLTIRDLTWRGLRCRVAVSGAPAGCQMDIRSQPNNPDTSMLVGKQPQVLKSDGSGSALVQDEGLIGASAYVIVLDSQSRPVAQQLTTVGKRD